MAKSAPKQIPFNGFVQIELNDDHVASIIKASLDPLPIFEQFFTIPRDSYNLTVKWLPDEKVYKVTGQCIKEGTRSYGWMLSAQAEDAVTAVAAFVYKHVGIMSEDWTPFCTQTRQAGGIR